MQKEKIPTWYKYGVSDCWHSLLLVKQNTSIYPTVFLPNVWNLNYICFDLAEVQKIKD